MEEASDSVTCVLADMQGYDGMYNRRPKEGDHAAEGAGTAHLATAGDGVLPDDDLDVQEAQGRDEARARLANEQVRMRKRVEKRWSRLSLFLLRVGERIPFIPASFTTLTPEEGTYVTEGVRALRRYYRLYFTTGVFALAVVFALYAGFLWLVSGTTRELSDGHVLTDVFAFSNPPVYSHSHMRKWVDAHLPVSKVPLQNLRYGEVPWFEAPIFFTGRTQNVTVEWLDREMREACVADGDAGCPCMAAVQLGISADAIFTDDALMFNTTVTWRSPEKIDVTINRVKAPYSAGIEVDFVDSAGLGDTKRLYAREAACVLHALRFVKPRK